MRTPPRGGGAAVYDDDGNASDRHPSLRPDCCRPQAPRQTGRPEAAAQARLHAQTERLAWGAYLRALRLQEDEPGPVTLIIRNAIFQVWKQTFLGQAS